MQDNSAGIERPWGAFKILCLTKFFWIKNIRVKQNGRLSLQSHRNRGEFWLVLSGRLIVEIDGNKKSARIGKMFYIPKNIKHRMTGVSDAKVLEIAFGEVCEEDIIRYEDDYGRA